LSLRIIAACLAPPARDGCCVLPPVVAFSLPS
jgi:hypothetical protein